MSEAFDSVDCTLMAQALAIAAGEIDCQDGNPTPRTAAALARPIMEALRVGVRDANALAEYALLHHRQPHRAVIYPSRLFEVRRKLRDLRKDGLRP